MLESFVFPFPALAGGEPLVCLYSGPVKFKDLTLSKP